MRQLITNPKQVGEVLRGRRAARRISQRALAAKLGISQGRFSTLEADPTTLALGRLIELAQMLGLELVLQDKAAAKATKAEW